MDLKRTLEILWRRRVVVLSLIALGVVAAVSAHLLSKRQYEARSVVLLVNTEAGRDPSLGNLDLPSLVYSDTVLTRFAARMGIKKDLRDLTKDIDAQIDTTGETGTNVPDTLPIAYRADSPDLAVRGANLLATELRGFYRHISASRYDDLANYLTRALSDERRRLDEIDRRLQTLQASDPYIAQSEAATAIGAQMLALDQQRALVTASLSGHLAQARIDATHVNEISPIVQHELLANDPVYQAQAQQLGHDVTAEHLAQSQFSDRYPGLPGMVDQVHREAAFLAQQERSSAHQSPAGSATYAAAIQAKEQVQALVAADQAQLTSLDEQLKTAQTHLSHVPDVGAAIAGLRRQRDAAEGAYQLLAQQRTLTLSQQAEAASLGSIVIVDRAAVAQRVTGKSALLLPLAAGLGFAVLGFTLPFLLEITDTRLRNREAVERLYGRPVFASV